MIFLQSMMAMADEAIPRAAENIALAIGALCEVRRFSILCTHLKSLKIQINYHLCCRLAS